MEAGEPDEIDIDTPSSARMYDYYLGGSTNFQADRDAAERVIAAVPTVPIIARANRAFLHRAVRYMTDRGVRQFLDIGSGVPTVGNVHETAQAKTPGVRTVYVDVDPVAVAHSTQLLKDNPDAAAIRADIRFPDYILGHPTTRELLDLSQPVGLLTVSMLHFLNDDDAYPAVERLRTALPAGSYHALSHIAAEGTLATAPTVDRVSQIYRGADVAAAVIRTRAGIQRFFGDATLVEPGLVWATQWHPSDPDPTDDPASISILAGVAIKQEPPQ